MSDLLRAEASSLLASARELLTEWVEEGVDRIETPRPSAAPQEAPSPAPVAAVGTRETPEAGPAPIERSPIQSLPSALDQVRETLGACTRCALSKGRRQIVFGDGNPHADLMFIGEGPGEQEDLQGLPFVGRAGELLTQMIEKGLGISRSEVYICNIVKCRPPENRTPSATEVSSCQPFLDGQIDAVKPRVIVSLGKPAASLLLGEDVAITRMRGTWHSYRGIPLMPTLHPAYILRQYTPENRRMVWSDLKAALTRSQET